MYKASGVETSQSLCGLAPKATNAIVPSFMEQVVANGGNGALKAQFSFYMSANPDAPSKLVFGDYDLAKYAKKGSNDTEIVWFDTTKDNVDMWALAVSSITFSGSEDQVNV